MQNYRVTGGVYKENRFCYELPRPGEGPAGQKDEEKKGGAKKEAEKQKGEKNEEEKNGATKELNPEETTAKLLEEIRTLRQEMKELRLERKKVSEEKSPQVNEVTTKRNTPTEKDGDPPLEELVLWQERRATAIQELKENTWGSLSNGQRGHIYAWHIPEGKSEEDAQLFQRDSAKEHSWLRNDYPMWEYCAYAYLPKEIQDPKNKAPDNHESGFSMAAGYRGTGAAASLREKQARSEMIRMRVEKLKSTRNLGTFIKSVESVSNYYVYHNKHYYRIDCHFLNAHNSYVFDVATSSWNRISDDEFQRIYKAYEHTMDTIHAEIRKGTSRDTY